MHSITTVSPPEYPPSISHDTVFDSPSHPPKKGWEAQDISESLNVTCSREGRVGREKLIVKEERW